MRQTARAERGQGVVEVPQKQGERQARSPARDLVGDSAVLDVTTDGLQGPFQPIGRGAAQHTASGKTSGLQTAVTAPAMATWLNPFHR